MPKQLWSVSLSGKWGGVRSITVSARTAQQAKTEARAFMRSDERIMSVTHTSKETK